MNLLSQRRQGSVESGMFKSRNKNLFIGREIRFPKKTKKPVYTGFFEKIIFVISWRTEERDVRL